MSLLKLMYAQIMANDNNGIYPHNLYERRGPKFNPNYTVKDKDSMRQEREFNINGIKVRIIPIRKKYFPKEDQELTLKWERKKLEMQKSEEPKKTKYH